MVLTLWFGNLVLGILLLNTYFNYTALNVQVPDSVAKHCYCNSNSRVVQLQ